jgi:tetratricopeptide (TPR) repeat protein
MTATNLEMPTSTLEATGPLKISVPALANFHAGLALMEAGCAKEAVDALARCVEQAPTFAEGHLCLGIAHAVTSNVYPAIDHLERATELLPNDFAAHYTLAKYYFTLRIPLKGYECAECALACASTREHRIALSQLLQKERERERNGIARPLFNRRFGIGFGIATLGAACAALAAVLIHLK